MGAAVPQYSGLTLGVGAVVTADYRLHCGHVIDVLRDLEAGSVQTVVTSPPYWGLRNYGTVGQVWGGDDACPHTWGSPSPTRTIAPQRDASGGVGGGRLLGTRGMQAWTSGSSPTIPGWQTCDYCGAWRGELGAEPTVHMYVEHIVQVFREVRRVLADSGTVWLNLGDSYAGSNKGAMADGSYAVGPKQRTNHGSIGLAPTITLGIASKNLIGVPWRVAVALQDDGWILRSDIIWHKTNPMPESVTDRPTKAHEYIFLLAKQGDYYYDSTAIREPSTTRDTRRPYTSQGAWAMDGRAPDMRHGGERRDGDDFTARNRRSVWSINAMPYPGAHYAVYPEALVDPCILAGTSAAGQCAACRAPWQRVVEKHRTFESGSGKSGNMPVGKNGHGMQGGGETRDIRRGPVVHTTTMNWTPSCACPWAAPEPQTVLDPFNGSGTTGVVALRHGRRYIGIDLNPEYIALARRRLDTWQAREEDARDRGQLALFEAVAP